MATEARCGPFVFQGDLKRGCAQAAKLGFDAIEIFPSSADAVDKKELHLLLKRHGLKVAAIGTGAGWLRHRLTLTHPDPAIRKQAREFIAHIINFAAGFSAPAIIGSMQGRVEADVARNQAEQWLAKALGELGGRAGKLGVSLLYEPLNRYETNLFNRAEEAAAFLTRQKIRHVKLLCDLFHMNMEEASIPKTFRSVAKHLGHIHFADTNRHAIGFGHLDVKPIIEALRDVGYDGYLSAEVLPLPNAEAAAHQTIRAFRKLTKD